MPIPVGTQPAEPLPSWWAHLPVWLQMGVRSVLTAAGVHLEADSQ